MKRMLAAIALALLLHGVLFLAGAEWFPDTTLPPRISQFVIVTMSYRHKPALKAESEKKEEAAQQEILKPELVEKSLTPQLIKPVEQEQVFEVQKQETAIKNVSEEATPKETLVKESGGATGRVQEAVPLYKINPPPRYPRTARRRGIQGTVVLSVYVDVQGRVDNLWVFESSGYRVLDNAALDSVKKWSFEPGRKGETPIAMWVNVPVRFELQ